MASEQLAFDWRWPAHQRFDYFYAGDNAPAVALLQDFGTLRDAPWPLLHGPTGTGKTHLLLATCRKAREVGAQTQFLPLTRFADNVDTVIRAARGNEFIALDDIDSLAGNQAAEHALFDLYNRARQEGSLLLFSTRQLPAHAGFALPDLVSRLNSCTIATLQPLSEPTRRKVLQQYASQRGIALDDKVLDWLFVRYARDLGSLAQLLEGVDKASLAAGRRITIPFLRSYLEASAQDQAADV